MEYTNVSDGRGHRTTAGRAMHSVARKKLPSYKIKSHFTRLIDTVVSYNNIIANRQPYKLVNILTQQRLASNTEISTTRDHN